MRFLPLLILFWVETAIGQSNPADTELSVADMKSDFLYLRQKLEQTHPGLYKHKDQPAMQRMMDSLESTIDRPMSFTSFYQKISFLIAEVRCEHTYATMGSRFNTLLKQWKMLPFQCFFASDKPLIVVNGTPDNNIHPGDEIISINGRPIDSILKSMYQFLPADGFMTSSKDHFLSSMNFGVAYNQFIEQPDRYDIVVRNNQGELISRSYTEDLNFAAINKHALKNPVNRAVLEASKRGDKIRKEKLRLTFERDDSVAIMTIRSFSIDKEPFKKKIDGFFETIAEKKPTDLVIDLSYNGGGEEELAAWLMSYLIDSPTSFMSNEYLIDTSDAMFSLSNVPDDVRKNKYVYIDSMKDGKSKAKITEYSMELQTMMPPANAYSGRVWLYVNGGTASAASTFAAVAQSNKRAVIVGQETAGSFTGGGTALGLDLTLPASGIKTHTSIVYQEFATSGKDGNRGVLPDYNYTPDFAAMIGNNREWITFIMALREGHSLPARPQATGK
ncbi:MAG: S41 family peptidase [Chitinophagaceae bacterium]